VWLARSEVRTVDYAIATLRGPEGQTIVRPFLNVASVGASALAVARIEGLKHRSPAWLAYAAGSLRAVAQLRAWTVGGVSDGRRRDPEPITLIAIGNGSTFGNGLIVAPGAVCDDGWLDVMWARELPRWQALMLLARMRSGSHVEHPRVETWRSRTVALDGPDGLPAQVELDGEIVGTLPLGVELRVGRLSLCAPT
jgi:diacylglycerol kinase (ATP)